MDVICFVGYDYDGQKHDIVTLILHVCGYIIHIMEISCVVVLYETHLINYGMLKSLACIDQNFCLELCYMGRTFFSGGDSDSLAHMLIEVFSHLL